MNHLRQLRLDIIHDWDNGDKDSFHYDRSELRGYLDCLEDSEFITKEEKYELMIIYSALEERKTKSDNTYNIVGKDYKISFLFVDRFESWLRDTFAGEVEGIITVDGFLEELMGMHESTGECTYELPAYETISGHTECISYDYEIIKTDGSYYETYTF